MTVPLLSVENLRTGFDTRDGFLRAVDGVDIERHQQRIHAYTPLRSVTAAPVSTVPTRSAIRVIWCRSM